MLYLFALFTACLPTSTETNDDTAAEPFSETAIFPSLKLQTSPNWFTPPQTSAWIIRFPAPNTLSRVVALEAYVPANGNCTTAARDLDFTLLTEGIETGGIWGDDWPDPDYLPSTWSDTVAGPQEWFVIGDADAEDAFYNQMYQYIAQLEEPVEVEAGTLITLLIRQTRDSQCLAMAKLNPDEPNHPAYHHYAAFGPSVEDPNVDEWGHYQYEEYDRDTVLPVIMAHFEL